MAFDRLNGGAGERTGIFRESETYSGRARGEKGEAPVGSFDGYAPLVVDDGWRKAANHTLCLPDEATGSKMSL